MSIGERQWFLILLLPLLLTLSLSDVSAAAADPSPQVIVLNSYHYGYAWSDNELAGLLARLRQDYPEIAPFIEYLDAKRLPGPAQLERMRDYLASKYRGKRIDLVIALDNSALEMAAQYRQEVFPGVPLVFAGINNFTPAMLRGRKKVTGVAEVEDIAGTLELALTLHPHTREVVMIHDYTTSGLAARRDMEAAARQFQDRVQFRFLPPSTFQEFVGQLQSLPANSLGLITSFVTDREGKVLSTAAGTRLCAASMDFPLYGTHDTRLGHGIVGGCLLNGAAHGKRAAEMALKVLAGEDPDRLPVDTAGGHRLMFDYRQMTRFGIPLAALPAESMVINRPESFYEQYKYLTIAVSWVFAFLLVAVGILAVTIVRQLCAERRLRESEEKYRTLVETTDTGYLILDSQGKVTDANQEYVRLTGHKSLEEILGRSVGEWTAEHDRERNAAEVTKCLQQGYVRGLEIDYVDEQGRITPIEINATVITTGQSFQIVSLCRDITERKQAEAELQRIAWLLRPKSDHQVVYESAYGDPTKLNTCRVLLNAIGQAGLTDIASDYISLLGTSSAVYEKNGDYAVGIFSSGWCRLLDQASYRQCHTDDLRQALACGQWHCHESCWTKASKVAMETRQATDIECDGGIRLYAVPIWANDEIVGAINFGYCDPPRDPRRLAEIAAKYGVTVEELRQEADKYETRPPFIIEIAKDRLLAAARLIGTMVERQRAEEDLRKSEKIYRLLVSQIPAMVFQGYGDWSVDPFDEKVEALTGYSKEDFESRRVKWCDLIPAEDLDYATRVFVEALKTDKSYVREHRLRKKDGEIIWVQCRGQIFCNDQGQVDYISGVSFDVTERRRAQEALKERERFLADIFDSIQDGISILDTDFNILRVNQALDLWFPHALPLAGKKCYAAYRQRSAPCEVCPSRETLETGKAGHAVMTKIGPDGETAGWLEVYTLPMLEISSGKVRGIIQYLRDITKRKQAEEALQLTEGEYRLLVNQIPAVVFKGYADWGVDFFDNKIEALTGYSKEEFDSRQIKWCELILPEDLQQAKGRFIKGIKSGGAYEREYRIRKKDGGIAWIQAMGQIFYDAEGKLDYISGVFFDITERKRAEERLREQMQFSATLLETIPAPVFYKDASGRYLGCNQAFEEFLGKPREQIIGKDVHDMGPLEIADKYDAMDQALFEQSGRQIYEWKVRAADGFEREVIFNKATFSDASGKAAGLIGVILDITERKRAEEDLRRSEARLAEAQRIAQVGNWEWNVKTNQAVWSEELFRIFHLPPQEYGLSYEEFMQYGHPDDRESLKKRIAEVQASGKPFDTDYRIILGDGSQRHVHIHAEIILDESGEPALMRGTAQDITERVLAEQKLRESNERFAAVFENAAIGIGVADAQGRIITANLRFQEMLGYHAGELLAKTFPEITHPEDLPKNLELFQEMMTGKSEGYQLEKRFLRKNGEYFWARVNVSSIKETKEQPAYSIAVVRDITLHKQTQEKLEESARNLRYLAAQLLTAQERERQRISRDLHDDLGQSLVALKLQLQAIIGREEPANLTELRQKLATQITFIDDIVDNVRRLCMDLRPTTLDVLGLTVALKRLFKEFGALHGIKFSLAMDDVRDLLSPQAQIIIYRIFQESLTNIAKYAQATRTTVTIKRESDTAFFTVQDNGKGFDLEQARTRAVGKRGLGLTAMEERVRMLGGTLEMQSQKGVGTRISFKIPASLLMHSKVDN
ncbi:MAG: ABC transporter substrate binding protein [Desulfobaccales bacterium]